MTDWVKNVIKTYRTYKTCKWIAITGGLLFTGGGLAIPMIAAEMAEQLAEEGLEDLIAGAAANIFGVTVEKIGEETVYKLADDVITSGKALELLESGYEGQVIKELGAVDLLGLCASRKLFISTQAAEDEDKDEAENSNTRLANNCLILIGSFHLSTDERKELNELLGTVMEISDPIQKNKELERLLSRLRKSNDEKKYGRDLFDDQTGQLKLSLGFS
ncbi:MAG: hypothetical protein EBE86_030470 [Hormoscilla sp. GUM202]|nr:hypothetical protein [Hormoscilla sp. GUM202]